MQQALFELEHVHQYETFHGPIKTQNVIQLITGTKWCWTCISWVRPDPEEMAAHLARRIKAGDEYRSNAIVIYCARFKTTFHEALLAIDIAIGNLNEGVK